MFRTWGHFLNMSSTAEQVIVGRMLGFLWHSIALERRVSLHSAGCNLSRITFFTICTSSLVTVLRSISVQRDSSECRRWYRRLTRERDKREGMSKRAIILRATLSGSNASDGCEAKKAGNHNSTLIYQPYNKWRIHHLLWMNIQSRNENVVRFQWPPLPMTPQVFIASGQCLRLGLELG